MTSVVAASALRDTAQGDAWGPRIASGEAVLALAVDEGPRIAGALAERHVRVPAEIERGALAILPSNAAYSVGGEFDPLSIFGIGGKYNPLNYTGVTKPWFTLPEKTLIEGAPVLRLGGGADSGDGSRGARLREPVPGQQQFVFPGEPVPD